MLDACLFMEETSRGLAPIGGYATTLIVAGATQRFGTEEQKATILGGIAGGAVEAIAMTEPEAGSDVGSLTTAAERVNGGFVISGQKVFCSNAHISDHILVVCRTTKGEDKHEGLSMIWVPADAAGWTSSRSTRWAAARPTTSTSTSARRRRTPLLGEVDQGWTQLMAGLNVERLILAATMLGIGQRAFDDALAYVKERRQFGRPIGSFQALQHRLADLATELEAARLMTYWVASKVDEDPDRMLPREASMVKLFVTETAKRVALEGMQMMGGYGYSSEYDMERLVRATPGLDHLRRHLGDPAQHHRQDAGPISGELPHGSSCRRRVRASLRHLGGLAASRAVSFFSSRSAPVVRSETASRGEMARGDVRIAVTLACEECKRRNYQTNKSRRNSPDRIELRKYCRWCGRHTPHKETR